VTPETPAATDEATTVVTSSPTATVDAGTVVTNVPNEGWNHVVEGAATAYGHNPPASGIHYPVWLRYEIYTTSIAPGYWVHNLEHGGIVFLHRTDAPASIVAALTDAYHGLPVDPECGDARALLTSAPDLPRLIAVVAANWVLEADAIDAEAINDFVLEHRDNAPESVCGGGIEP